jgi:hypothetical protein
MRLTGLLLLVSGWAIVLAAFVMLGAAMPRAAFVMLGAAMPRAAFVAAGVAIEILGLGLVARSHVSVREARR